MRKRACVAAIMLLIGAASQAQTIGMHGGTYHFFNRGLNEVNPGMYYVSKEGYTVGGYYNSYNKPTFYAGMTMQGEAFGVSLVLATGYEGRVKSPVVPILSPSYRYGSVRLSLPNLQGIHLSLEKKL